jgi:thiol-disulfide isomerase/thioredoxin
MRKSLITIALLAAAAGLTGLAIGLAATHARHFMAGRTGAGSHAASREVPSTSRGDATNERDTSRVIRFAKNPTPAPPFLVNDLDGNVISTAAWHGKAVVLNFWATWCPPCREEIPELINLANHYKDRLQIIGVSMDEDATPEEVKTFARQVGINYPIVMGSHGIAAEYGGVPALPTSFILNTDGQVVQKHVGLYPADVYDSEVRALVGLPVNATVETFEDTGQIFLKNAARATTLPDVDFKGLTAAQKTAVLKQLNSETCTCGCGLTIAQCRINDTTCPVSKQLAAKMIQAIVSRPRAPDAPTADP